MEKIVNEILKEVLYREKLECGLELLFIPKKGFTKKYAVFATNYGSNDLEFVPLNETEKIKVNAGIAHFLEHKMFEQPDGGNAFDKFSDFGASANAFTNFNMTAYLFSTTENFYESLTHLLDYVKTPYFTDENVEKEKGIIEQEINMYEDNADFKVYFNLLKALYVNHPIRIDIAGTVNSIYKITKDELYKCYNTFYDLSNMCLFIIGDLELEKIVQVANDALKNSISKNKVDIKRFYPQEPKNVNQKEIVENLSVSIPLFNIGFKDNNIGIEGKELLKKEICTEIINDMIFKKGSSLYEQLYLKGLINENFGADFASQVDYGYTIIAGESKNPKKVKDILLDYIKNNDLKEEDFNRSKKRKIGIFLKSFDSIEYIANNFMAYKFKDINFIDYLEVLKSISFEDCKCRYKEHFDENYCAVSIINPK